jgi:hypothetical protein
MSLFNVIFSDLVPAKFFMAKCDLRWCCKLLWKLEIPLPLSTIIRWSKALCMLSSYQFHSHAFHFLCVETTHQSFKQWNWANWNSPYHCKVLIHDLSPGANLLIFFLNCCILVAKSMNTWISQKMECELWVAWTARQWMQADHGSSRSR